jgi:coatomer subunit beta
MQEHRHSFVRKNAVFAVYSIFQDHEHLIPDAPELIDTFLAAVRLHKPLVSRSS